MPYIQEKVVTLQQVAKIKITCPDCGKFLLENKDAQGKIICFCKRCKKEVEIVLKNA